jgi:hypothetical protein
MLAQYIYEMKGVKIIPKYPIEPKDLDAFEKIQDHFFFVYPEDELGGPDYTMKNIEKIFEYLIFDIGIEVIQRAKSKIVTYLSI